MTTETMNEGAFYDLKKARVALTVISMLHRRADSAIEKGDDEMKKFTDDLQYKNAVYAFEWSHSVMNAAAAREVALYIKNCLKAVPDETDLWALRESVNDRVISSAKYPKFSTSPTSNLMEQFKTAAFAEWASLLNQAIEHLEAEGITSTTDEA